MEIKVLLFGMIAEHCGSRELTLKDVHDTEELSSKIKELYPRLSSMKYFISVDRKIIHTKTNLEFESEVALLPPFSGG